MSMTAMGNSSCLLSHRFQWLMTSILSRVARLSMGCRATVPCPIWTLQTTRLIRRGPTKALVWTRTRWKTRSRGVSTDFNGSSTFKTGSNSAKMKYTRLMRGTSNCWTKISRRWLWNTCSTPCTQTTSTNSLTGFTAHRFSSTVCANAKTQKLKCRRAASRSLPRGPTGQPRNSWQIRNFATNKLLRWLTSRKMRRLGNHLRSITKFTTKYSSSVMSTSLFT